MNSSTKAPSVPPAELARVVEKATCWSVQRGNEVLGNFAGPDALEIARSVAGMLNGLASTEQASAVSPPTLAKLRAEVEALRKELPWTAPSWGYVLELIDQHGGALEQQQGHQSERSETAKENGND